MSENRYVVWRPARPGHPLDCYLTRLGAWTNCLALARIYFRRDLADLDARSRQAEAVPLASLRYPEHVPQAMVMH